jgi:hypothetical protein
VACGACITPGEVVVQTVVDPIEFVDVTATDRYLPNTDVTDVGRFNVEDVLPEMELHPEGAVVEIETTAALHEYH